MLKIALTHDIDRLKKTHQYFTHSLRSVAKFDFSSFAYQIGSMFGPEPYWMIPDLIEIENNYNVKSTFFFLNESIKINLFKLKSYKLALGRYNIHDKKIVEIIQWLDKNGWEVGLHGSYNSYKDIGLLRKEKEILETIVGHEVIGIRQHYLNLSKTTWNIQKEVGFLYDSSFGHKQEIGFKNGQYLPFNPIDKTFTVFPLLIMDSCFMNTKDRWGKLDQIIDFCHQNGSVLVINFHQRVFNEKEFPGYKNSYINIIEKCIENKAQFFTIKEIYQSFES